MDDSSGSDVVDTWLGDNNGVATPDPIGVGNGPVPVAGVVGGALSFNGTSSSVQVADASNLNFGTGDLSIDAWVTVDPQASSGVRPIVDKRDKGGAGGGSRGYEFFVYNGLLGFQLADAATSNNTCAPSGSACTNYVTAGPNIADGTPHHLAVSLFRTGTPVLTLYVDGVPVLTNANPRTGDVTNAAPLLVGRLATEMGTDFFAGWIDELEIFSRAIEEAEVKAIFNAGPTGKCKAPADFLCYTTQTPQGTAAFTTVHDVSVEDQFGQRTVDVNRPTALCAPINKSGEDPAAPAHPEHLRYHRVGHVRPWIAPALNQKVVNQFGTFFLNTDIHGPTGLLVPSAKSLAGSPAAPTSPSLDHFLCYYVRQTLGTALFQPISGLNVEDQFRSRLVDVVKPTRLCAPANKNGEDPSAPTHRDHLLCFGIRLSSLSLEEFGPPIGPIYTNNQFGPEAFSAVRLSELCVLSAKNPVCGDGIAEVGEDCDDGNVVEGDGCDSNCTLTGCGNGIVTAGEECDDSNEFNADACKPDCALNVCGDGVLYTGVEECDDGNLLAGDGCSNQCQVELDHFLCYPALRPSLQRFTVSLEDQFLPNQLFSSVLPRMLCNPANKNGEDPSAPSHEGHLLDYGSSGPRTPLAGINRVVINQFGVWPVNAFGGAQRLLVPTAKSLIGSPPAPDPATVDHFTCYNVRFQHGTPAPFSRVLMPTAQITDQFGTRDVVVGVDRPTRLCVPANKNGENPDAPGHSQSLMCYNVGASSATLPAAVFVNNQFGAATIRPGTPKELCVPSEVRDGESILATKKQQIMDIAQDFNLPPAEWQALSDIVDRLLAAARGFNITRANTSQALKMAGYDPKLFDQVWNQPLPGWHRAAKEKEVREIVEMVVSRADYKRVLTTAAKKLLGKHDALMAIVQNMRAMLCGRPVTVNGTTSMNGIIGVAAAGPV